MNNPEQKLGAPFTLDGEPHPVGSDCDECWGDSYPKTCECGGNIHAVFGDENWDGYWLYTKCDRCGESE